MRFFHVLASSAKIVETRKVDSNFNRIYIFSIERTEAPQPHHLEK